VSPTFPDTYDLMPTLRTLPTATAPAPGSERHRLLASADALFDERGFAPVTVGRIARHAGVEPERMHAEFPAKLGLVVEVLRLRHEAWFRGLDQATTAPTDPRDGVLAVFTYLETCFQPGFHGCMFINGYGELGRKEPVIAALADEHLAEVERHVADLCRRAALPASIAQAIALLVDGAKVEAAIHGTTQPARTARTAAAMLISVYQTDPEA
jgi:AcrR family transcriptional regulator